MSELVNHIKVLVNTVAAGKIEPLPRLPCVAFQNAKDAGVSGARVIRQVHKWRIDDIICRDRPHIR